ncbi:MAG TPA: DUF3592 domain-containing protein, partial [Terracidiphilus sp.]
ETPARVDSARVEQTSHSDRYGRVTYTYAAGDSLLWKDRQGEEHNAEFKVDDESSLYQLVGGECVTIRYNPAQPDQYYYRELLRSRIRRMFQIARNWTIGIAAFAFFTWLAAVTRGR